MAKRNRTKGFYEYVVILFAHVLIRPFVSDHEYLTDEILSISV